MKERNGKMKIRSGFVSNSSSSSFIVAVKKGKKAKVKLELEVDLADYSNTTLSNKEDVLAYLKDHYGYEKGDFNDNYVVKIYTTIMEYINNGDEIIVGSFSSDGNITEEYLCNTGLNDVVSKSVTVIQSDAGY